MDYSASIHDADNPSGSSPWGNSPVTSPQADRTTFGSITGESPAPPPDFASQISGNGFEAANDDGGFGSSDHGFRRPGTASTFSEADTFTQATEPVEGDGPVDDRQFPDENLAPPQAHDANRLSGDTARPSQEQPQPRRSSKPVDKLQAKITGLERAARKDPILRFDVHVGLHSCPPPPKPSLFEWILTVTDQHFKIPNNSVSRRETYAFRICEAGRTSDLRESGSNGPRCPATSDIRWRRY